MTPRWERERPWSSSPSGSVIIWAVLRWELPSPPSPSAMEHICSTTRPILRTNLIAPDSLLFFFSLSLLTQKILVNLKVLIPLQLSKVDFLCQNVQAKLINPSLCFSPLILNSGCWSIVEYWSWVWSPPSLSPVFDFHAFSAQPVFPLSFSLWTWILQCSFNQLSSSLTLPFPKLPQCIDCKSDLGGSEAGAEVRIRNKQLYCNSCYMRFKSKCSIKLISIRTCCVLAFLKCNIAVDFLLAGQPTAMWCDCAPADWWRDYLWQQPMNIQVNIEAILK